MVKQILSALALRSRLSKFEKFGGDEENRTPDPLLARQVLSQLSYAPIVPSFVCSYNLVGLSGLEPLTSRLSGVRSNQLSYRPFLSVDHRHLLR